jgi:2-polyprenyl-6-hydroxyphenyl methylase / 3-demethylubiquinone-9 3-methyltransferase
MTAYLIPLALQAVAMIVDEGWYHRKRGLPRWERLGHPLDTLTIVICLAWLVCGGGLAGYAALAVGSTVFVTKDEPTHARLCCSGEHWLHALLFVLHPLVLLAFTRLPHAVLVGQLAVTIAFMLYQLVYWNVVRAAPRRINNRWYRELGDRWYRAQDTPIALLRAESRHRNPWIADVIGPYPRAVLDLGCGAGFLSNYLAARGHRVRGLDADAESLEVARAYDRTASAEYVRGNACSLPYDDASFDVVCAMDLLEHVEDPARLVAEAARVLAPGGVFFFHTFNRTWLAKLIVIDGVRLFVKNTPKDLHVLRMFVPPQQLAEMCTRAGLEITCVRGSRPRFRWPLWRMLVTGKVGDDFSFTFTASTRLGFTGYARKVDSAARSAS